MNWVRELKVGDEFLDDSGNFLGTVLATSNKEIAWKWERLPMRLFHDRHTVEYDELDVDGKWTKVTPLIKELL